MNDNRAPGGSANRTGLCRADGYPVTLVPVQRFARLHVRLRHRLPVWVVCRTGTREYPGHFVARMHISLPETRPTRFVIVEETLSDLRGALPPGLARLNRHAADAPEIIEVWL